LGRAKRGSKTRDPWMDRDNFPCERPAMDGWAGQCSMDGCMHLSYPKKDCASNHPWSRNQPGHPWPGVRREKSPLDSFLFPPHPPAPLVRALADLGNISSANAFKNYILAYGERSILPLVKRKISFESGAYTPVCEHFETDFSFNQGQKWPFLSTKYFTMIAPDRI
jgi:hypothetical protein